MSGSYAFFSAAEMCQDQRDIVVMIPGRSDPSGANDDQAANLPPRVITCIEAASTVDLSMKESQCLWDRTIFGR